MSHVRQSGITWYSEFVDQGVSQYHPETGTGQGFIIIVMSQSDTSPWFAISSVWRAMAEKSENDVPDCDRKILVIHPESLANLLNREVRWLLRRVSTAYTGQVAFGASGSHSLWGRGILSACDRMTHEELSLPENFECHKEQRPLSLFSSDPEGVWTWKFEDVKRFKEPIKCEPVIGASTWRKMPEDIQVYVETCEYTEDHYQYLFHKIAEDIMTVKSARDKKNRSLPKATAKSVVRKSHQK